jgi:hypothetical protein
MAWARARAFAAARQHQPLLELKPISDTLRIAESLTEETLVHAIETWVARA